MGGGVSSCWCGERCCGGEVSVFVGVREWRCFGGRRQLLLVWGEVLWGRGVSICWCGGGKVLCEEACQCLLVWRMEMVDACEGIGFCR